VRLFCDYQVLGSAMIAFGLIPASALLFSQHRALQIEVWPLLRETSFYLAGLCLFLKVIADSVTETLEAVAITSVYFLYVGTVVGVHLFRIRNIHIEKEKKTPREIEDDLELSYINTGQRNMDEEVAELTKNLFPDDNTEQQELLLRPSLSAKDLELQLSDDSTGAFSSSSLPVQISIPTNNSTQEEGAWDTIAGPIRSVLSYIIPTLHQRQSQSPKLTGDTLVLNISSRNRSSSPVQDFMEKIVGPTISPPHDHTYVSDSDFLTDTDNDDKAKRETRSKPEHSFHE